MKIKTVEAEFVAGSDVDTAVFEAIDFAKREGCVVRFTFNGISFALAENSDATKAINQYYKVSQAIQG